MTDLHAALAFLDAHINLEATAGRIHGLSLDRMRALTHVLGDPQAAYPVVQVTGTNGKGSVTAMTSALLRATGLGVGTYTSPHLESITERLTYDGVPIDPDEFAQLIVDVAALEPLLSDRPSYFELLTAAAFRWFADRPVDVAVVEVGLLGLYDATNVADAQVAVLTNVGKDHTDGVGDWRRRIAEEKVGIVKPGATFVLGETDPELADVFAHAPAAETWVRGRDFDVVDDRVALGGHMVSLATPAQVIDEIFLPLHGAHQVANASLALAATEALVNRPLDADLVREAFASVQVPGRFEVVANEPTVIIDGAHNPDGARVAAATLTDDFTLGGSLVLVVGMLGGRDPAEMLDALGAREAGFLIACTPPSPRAIPAAEVAAAADGLGIVAEAVPDVADAVRRALALATTEDLVLVTGSLYVIGAARRAIVHGEALARVGDHPDEADWIRAWDDARRGEGAARTLATVALAPNSVGPIDTDDFDDADDFDETEGLDER
ncbi:MAG TPA: folylpolyglutamate synthase/dihydrofolate synthase family protein [Acidimicrobiales bacterium]|nr:folylpolyglutamate synthase/dihydrofolate synthase family protein [Acidimicrobiales bacterium]